MDRLRPRQRPVLSGFTKAEIEKMEKLSVESRELLQSKEFCQKIARSFSSSSARAGKPIVKWTEVQSWFGSRQQESTSKVPSFTDTSENQSSIPETCPLNNGPQNSQTLKVDSQPGEKIPDLSELKFEAKSCKDGAWYDVDMFLGHRFLSSGEADVRVRFVGYGAADDEWVNVKKAVRKRSIPFEHSECNKLVVGDLVLCLQERGDQSIYYDAHVVKIDRKMHDIRGCRKEFDWRNYVIFRAYELISLQNAFELLLSFQQPVL
ncbi:Chromo domain-containing protein T09A5.8 [Hibiscus syriacus]|uniref:Chromo domain-containing protein T09A5.8 n=1 Tax=Hibiscus syriacus TaxID=106335 RepID=A0A6A2YT39_HIBSY|nr:Chromo domain-containing protein T09A5.8 [Hibiscus syriacus]